MHSLTRLGVAFAAASLAACGGVAIKPESKLPTALIPEMPAKVALVVTPEMRRFEHKETRWGVDWAVTLGPGHEQLWKQALDAEFRDVTTLDDPAAIAGTAGLLGAFEPRIELYSFATARETGGAYYAVTIQYRINVYSPDGKPADSLTLTGYGNSLSKGMSSGPPLEAASLAAMRDAAAKFLVQFPELALARPLSEGRALVASQRAQNRIDAVSSGVNADIEAVPIEEEKQAPVALPPVTPPATPALPPTESAPRAAAG